MTARTQREAVLVILNSDGFVEVFAEDHVDVRLQVAPHATSQEGERLAEEYVDRTLPRRYRKLYFPGMRRAADLCRRITPADITRRDCDLAALRFLKWLSDASQERSFTDGDEVRQCRA